MLTIWGRKTSSNVQALMWCVGELGLDYLRFDVGHRYGGTDSEAFYQLNPIVRCQCCRMTKIRRCGKPARSFAI